MSERSLLMIVSAGEQRTVKRLVVDHVGGLSRG